MSPHFTQRRNPSPHPWLKSSVCKASQPEEVQIWTWAIRELKGELAVLILQEHWPCLTRQVCPVLQVSILVDDQ